MWNLYEMLAEAREQEMRREVRARSLLPRARRVRPRSAAPGPGGRVTRPEVTTPT